MLKANIITLFPELIKNHFNFLPIKKALEIKEIEINLIDLKKYSTNNYGSVDSKPYGGGTGMILQIEPLYNALEDNKLLNKKNNKVYLMTPKGNVYDQQKARELADFKEFTLICGRYEGVDQRIYEFIDGGISIGNYILSGGELASLVIIESVTRLLPKVLEKEDATLVESFSTDTLEFPQYTRPQEFKGLRVPDVLLSGDHAKIEKWRKENSKKV